MVPDTLVGKVVRCPSCEAVWPRAEPADGGVGEPVLPPAQKPGPGAEKPGTGDDPAGPVVYADPTSPKKRKPPVRLSRYARYFPGDHVSQVFYDPDISESERNRKIAWLYAKTGARTVSRPGLLLSILLHFFILFLFSLIVIVEHVSREPIGILNIGFYDPSVPVDDAKTEEKAVEEKKDDEQTAEQAEEAQAPGPETLDDVTFAEKPPDDRQSLAVSTVEIEPLEVAAKVLGVAASEARVKYSGRSDEEFKRAVGLAFGSPGKYDMLGRSLAWLAKHQDADGKWSGATFHEHDPKNAIRDEQKYGTRYDRNFDSGVTALALLAYLGVGEHYRKDGQYGPNVAKGIDYLLRTQNPDGTWGLPTGQFGRMYQSALAGFALAEAYILTGDERLFGPIRKSANSIIGAQRLRGGWDYDFSAYGVREDLSLTGWIVMSLMSMRAAGVEIPEQTLRAANEFTDFMRASDDQTYYQFSDQQNMRTEPSRFAMVPVELTIRHFLGVEPDARREAELVRTILKRPPRIIPNVFEYQQTYYNWYYSSLALYHANPELSFLYDRQVVETLVGLEGRLPHTQGSFEPVTVWALRGSRVYATALAALTLEVHYRYLPKWMGKSRKEKYLTIYKHTPKARRAEVGKYLVGKKIATANELGKIESGARVSQLADERADTSPYRLPASALEAQIAQYQLTDNDVVKLRLILSWRGIEDAAVVRQQVLILIHEKADLAKKALENLTLIAKDDFGYDPARPDDAAIERWKRWFVQKYNTGID